MSLVRNLALMGTSTALRLGFGMLTFVVMARLLGPAQFGVLMLWLSVATLLSLIANYGLAPYLLREIGAVPASARSIMSEVLSAKLLLTALVLLLALASLPWVSPDLRLIFALLLAAQLAESLTEFYNVGYRATNRFAEETRIASIAVLAQFAVVTLALWWRAEPLVAAGAFLASRLLVLAITSLAQRAYFKGMRPAPLAKAWTCVMRTKSYAIDFSLQSLIGQIDSVVLNHFIGPVAVGLYQAGMRLFNGGAQAAGILANVFLPRAAATSGDKQRFRAESGRIQWAFVSVGLAFGLALALLAEPLVALLFGADYAPLAAVLPWFGLLFFVRFFAASWGVLLTSAGQQNYRAAINVVQWLVVAALSWVAVPQYGMVGWLACLTIGNALLALAYIARGLQLSGLGWRQPAIATAAAASFIPFLHLPKL
ncbi:oligosaccharide flippase family protein [Paucibacter sp. XJ19-41]|uniref:oligosaccharide flippase family protein n=1 Tax=Paucibacter sp. XJ19-41 TaxID=2927824 RepID=UPI0023499EC6|nr:oligosaccharide flippase family protein [Paucibacter sp. XJ19-41]MDC6166642.1 oligosaccharide flippase family protein [Paucibacter sp. XJ19-41]